MWITNGPDADVLIVYAKTSPDRKSRGITAFVEKDFPDFQLAPSWISLACAGRSPASCCLRIKVPVVNILGGEDAGVEVLMRGLDFERLVCAGAFGDDAACMDEVVPYVVESNSAYQ